MEPCMSGLDHGHDQTRLEAYHHAAVLLHDAVSEATGGAVLTNIHPEGRLGSETQMMDKLIAGELALANVTTANAATFIPELSLLSTPYLFSDSDHFTRAILDKNLQDFLRKIIQTRQPALDCIAWFTPGPRNIYSRTKPVTCPADVNGLRLRVMASAIETQIWQTLGASPIALPFSEIENAMKTGKVEAAEDTAAVYATQHHYKIGPYHSLTAHQWSVALILMNTNVVKELSYELPQVLMKAGASISRRSIEYAVLENSEKTKALRRTPGVQVIDPDLEPFKSLTRDMPTQIAEHTQMQEGLGYIRAHQ